MTCIVGLVDKNEVYIGGDSAGVAPPFVMMKLSTSSVKYSKAVHNIIRL